MSLESFWKQVIRKEKALWLLPLLKGVSLLYQGVLSLRHFLYDRGFFKSHLVNAPVISIGNIAMGGTGKTPLALLLASRLKEKFSLAILSRGYKGKNTGTPLLVSDYDKNQNGYQIVGDEPLLLSRKLHVPVYIGKDRTQSAKLAIERGAKLLLLDDGMQQRKLKKTIEIALLDPSTPLDALFPYGYLRDLPSRLRVASLIALHPVSSQKQFEDFKEKLRAYSDAPLIGITSELLIPPSITKVGAFCAIAQPQRWINMLEEKGITVVDALFYSDHASITEKKLRAFWSEAKAKGASHLVLTEKDGVKISSSLKKELPIVEVPLKLNITYNAPAWEEMIEKIGDKEVQCTKN